MAHPKKPPPAASATKSEAPPTPAAPDPSAGAAPALTASTPVSLADLASEDEGAPRDEQGDPSPDRLDADSAEVEALRREIETLNRLHEVEVKRLIRHLDAAAAEVNTLRKALDEANDKLASLKSEATAPVKPTNIPEGFVLARWKDGTYDGTCFTLKGERLSRARGAMSGYFPERMVTKLPAQFARV